MSKPDGEEDTASGIVALRVGPRRLQLAVCYDQVIVELKALDKLGGKEKAQVINYLKATSLERSLLLNFGTVRLEYERLILSKKDSSTDYADNADEKQQEEREEQR